MARIRYIGEHLIARAFERTFHRNHWDEDNGLQDHHVVVLANNPQFEVDDAGSALQVICSPSDTGETPTGSVQ